MAAPQDPERDRTTAVCESVADVALNVNGGLSQDIAELFQQGVELENNNEPYPENSHPSAPETHTIGQWLTPIIFPGRTYVNCHNTKGVWRLHSWPNVYEMTDIYLFRIAFSDQWVRDVLIPATNKEISGDNITLQELYVYLGCPFFMACFEGIYDWRLCCSPKPVSIREVSPFWMQKYMALCRFISITSATRFTNMPSP